MKLRIWSCNSHNSKMKNGKIEAISLFLIIVLTIGMGLLIFSLMGSFGWEAKQGQDHPQMKKARMLLTPFDREIGRKLMDQNDDGKCDVCGMPVEQCLDTGQIECNMGMDAGSKIGVLGSQHAHASFMVYINGRQVDFNRQKYFVKSMFMHVENDAEDSGKVLHMHAERVPLWLFFESIGIKFSKDCFVMDDGVSYCNNAKNNLKFYVNDRENNEFENYVFNDLDKILISYGNESREQIQNQLNSITKFMG